MKEKELRLALVCYGGVSLAVYQHGIATEVLSLVRASKAYHAVPEAAAKASPERSFDAAEGERDEDGSEPIYFDFLRAIGDDLDLRVVVDVVAGSSAGGVNGITLARALAHDLSLEPLTDLWLAKADIQQLLSPAAKARAFSKWYLMPLIGPLLRRLGREGVLPDPPDEEMRTALSTFVRSRWFQPPLDGPGFCAILLDGLRAMGAGRSEQSSLLPAGHRLDLIVTVTDYHGAARSLFAHDPPVVSEREHRHALRFSFEHPQGGAAQSDFGRDDIPSLAFAARATASFPGAFPPAQLQEMDAVLAARDEAWPGRARFIEVNFGHYAAAGLPPTEAVLLDGSVLNNKPLSEARAAARTHRAFREVDRRLVYIDPRPEQQPRRATTRRPSFFSVLRGALSDLPRYEPIYDELLEIGRYNDQVRQRRTAVEASRSQVAALVEKVAEGRLEGPVTPEDLRRWRLNGPALMTSGSLAYNSWVRLVVDESVALVVHLICTACGYPSASPRRRWLEQVVEAWAEGAGVYVAQYGHPAVAKESELPPFGRFVANFGVEYKRRRIAFVIQTINKLYRRTAEPGCHVDPSTLDLLKRRLYRSLDALRVFDDVLFLNVDLLTRIRILFGDLPEVGAGSVPPSAAAFAREHREEIDLLLDRLSDACDLVGLNEEVDAVLASPLVARLGPACQHELLLSYIGFLFWDIVLLPMTETRGVHDANAMEEILVDRISPEDATSLKLEGGPVLRGATLAGFGGFFSRANRENDYLWGRLNAVDRLFDLLAGAARVEAPLAALDVLPFKKRAFERILRREKRRLAFAADLISELEAAVAKL